MTSVPDSVSDDVILEDPGEDPDQWPEFRGDRPKGKLEKIRWGQGVRSEEEEYLAKLGEAFGDPRETFADFIGSQRTSWPE
jgi:hypothetical protein